ncbi:hypothetical protein BJ878DRAFT_499088 [Calycina marina]|uniref:DUF676 domain-containing protein n=1 Tax=Calycina marina TaxID=1763456 RepID=A0A9P8CG79_9HELO|nr:hypothetical protein BJ878DRAFT_499088 [Calycina marina]
MQVTPPIHLTSSMTTSVADEPIFATNATSHPDIIKNPELNRGRFQDGSPQQTTSYFRSPEGGGNASAEHVIRSEPVTNINDLSFIRDPPVARGPYYSTQVDIIAVPAIGGHPEKTWASRAKFDPNDLVPRTSEIHKALINAIPLSPGFSGTPTTTTVPRAHLEKLEPLWITSGIRARASNARIFLYDHGTPTEGDTLKTLATRLLRNIDDLRRIENSSRPLFFIAHSTGGLVLKLALAGLSSRSRTSILGDCYGITFFSTPHRGSSHLSRQDFALNISKLMRLKAPLPESIYKSLHLDHPLLAKLDHDFRSIATEMHVWTFFETEDTHLANEYHAPITSIKSALLNLRHEAVYPLLSDHVSCAGFGPKNLQTKESYLGELTSAIKKAIELSKIKHTEMNLEDRVKVDIIGFYEISDDKDVPIEVWSTSRSLKDLKRMGPARLLEDRFSETNTPPSGSGRLWKAPSFLPDRRKDVGPGLSDKKSDPELRVRSSMFRRSKSKDRNSQDFKACNGQEWNPSCPPSENLPSIAVVGDHGLLSPETSRRKRERSRERGLQRSNRRSSIAIETSPIVFVKPDASKQRLLWVHVPFNNPIWVRDILSAISTEKGRDCHHKLIGREHWESKHVRGRHAEHHACFLKPACDIVGGDITSPLSSPRHYFGSNAAHLQMYLYLPYLHFDSYKAIVRRRTIIKRRIRQGRSGPVPASVAKLDSLELKVTWQFLGHDPPINCRRTLDQFGYPSLLDTRARDDDQMLYKMTKQRFAHHDEIYSGVSEEEKKRMDEIRRLAEEEENSSSSSDSSVNTDDELEDDEEEAESEAEENEEDILDGNVLMVDQLWLWIVDSETALSFFPKKEPLVTDGRLFQQADLRNSIFNEVNADLTARCENAFDLSALIALHAVTVLFERSSHPDLEIFRTFEEAISILTEKMTSSFKRFRARGFRDKANEQDEHLRAHNIRAKHKREGELAERQNRENTSALLELRDIEDELHTLEELFDVQTKTIRDMIENYKREDVRSLAANGLLFLLEAEDYLSDYKRHVQRMIDDVKATREDFDKLLQMVQRQAQVDEVRLQRLQTDLASAQSRSVMIFTVFTVIFLPLTFFCGLFGMNTREWGGGDFLTLRTIGLITLPSSFVIVLVTCIVAWSSSMRKFTNEVRRGVVHIFESLRKSTMEFLYHIPALASLANKEARKKKIEEIRHARKLKKEEKKQAAWFDEDFWESNHIAARDKDYAVPSQNRKSVTFARKKALAELEEQGKFGFFSKRESEIYARAVKMTGTSY